MAFTKGNKLGTGRPKGAQNKEVKEIREAFKELIENNLENMTKWLERVGRTNPDKALTIINGLSEYVLPKLQRSETDVKMTVTENKKNTLDLFPPVDETTD